MAEINFDGKNAMDLMDLRDIKYFFRETEAPKKVVQKNIEVANLDTTFKKKKRKWRLVFVPVDDIEDGRMSPEEVLLYEEEL